MPKLVTNQLWQQLAIATNWPMLVAAAVLSALGVISIFADARADAMKQLIFLAVAVGCMALFQAVDYRKIGRWSWGFYVLSLLLILYTVVGSKDHAAGRPQGQGGQRVDHLRHRHPRREP